jgi:L-fucose isomerase
MIKPRVALFNFSEGRQREDVYQKRRPIAIRETKRLTTLLENDVELLQMPHQEIRSKSELRANVAALGSTNADAVLLHVPIFVAPNLVGHAAALINKPLALVANESSDSLSQLALLSCGGAMDQIGISYKRLPGDLSDHQNLKELVAFLRAAAAASRLRGMTFGAIGGRSLGISTGSADLVLWERTFGIDIEHIDQFEIVRRAERTDPQDVSRHMEWLTANLAGIEYNDTSFTKAHLERQVRSYLATKSIVRDYELDFVGIKCQPEMSNGYVLQCLNVALLNDPYDADGSKEPVPCSCETDHDGALTMQILKLLSGNKPTNLNDIVQATEQDMVLVNCGSMATWFANYSDDPAENLRKVHMVPHSFGEAGGGTTQLICAPGSMTLARLCRRGDTYWFATLVGESEWRDRDTVSKALWSRPLLFSRTDIDKRRFLRYFGSNHLHAVRGHYTQELTELCGLLGIQLEDFGNTHTVAT